MNRLTSNKLILEELKHILKYEDNQDESIISLHDISILIKKENFKFNRMYITNINKEIVNTQNNVKIIVSNFNYDKEELILTLNDSEHYKIICTKENNKLNINVLNTKKHFSCLNLYKKEISDIYDEFMSYKDYMKQNINNGKSFNSSFLINITHEGVSIFTRNYNEEDNKKFILSSYYPRGIYADKNNNQFIITAYNSKENYLLRTDSNEIKELISDIENKIFKNIYIKIEDCPEWTKDKLYEIRKSELSNTKIKKKIKKHC